MNLFKRISSVISGFVAGINQGFERLSKDIFGGAGIAGVLRYLANNDTPRKVKKPRRIIVAARYASEAHAMRAVKRYLRYVRGPNLPTMPRHIEINKRIALAQLKAGSWA